MKTARALIFPVICLFSLALALGLPAAPAAAETIYDCAATSNVKRSKYGKGSYIAPTLRLVIDEATGTATVYDSVIAAEHGGPIAAKLARGGNALRLNWSLLAPFRKNRKAKASYSLTLDLARMTASIRVTVHGEFQDTLGKARCAVAK